ncbi:MAG: HAMP domain-containing sensor histidine kinase [Sulfuricurvum sp.]
MSAITQEELSLLIEQTYRVEREFSTLKASYDHLQGTIEEIVEFLPTAIWIFNDDGSVFLQNSQAKELAFLVRSLHPSESEYEISHGSRSYLVKNSIYKDKRLYNCTDITEQKRKENLATMGQMAAHLSHEIRNPVGSIALLSSTLKKRVMQKNIPIVDEIQKATYRIERIIKATLLFSRGIKIGKSAFLWSDLLEDLQDSISFYGYTKEIEFNFYSAGVELFADKDLLGMLFSNLVLNAIDAIELDENESGTISIEYERDEFFHRFLVCDSGVRVERKDDLFEAFRSSKVKGNGLGLVLSKEIAKAHGGDVVFLDAKRKCFLVTII